MLKNKLLHSVELLRKAEKLALRYDKEDGFFLAFSAGKDSQALYHVAKMAGVRFKAHINWTSVDPPQVIRFKRREYPDVVEKAPEWSIYDRAVQRGILPSMRIRWCCADFKETAGAGKVTLIGIRSEESIRRAKRHEVEVSSKKFSGDLDQFYEWQEAELKRKEGILSRRLKREKRKINEDEFSMMKENEVRCIGGKDSILISPIFDWTEKDVWYFLNEVVHAPHCELYDKGYKRIGCILCPMSSHKQKLKEMQDFPHVKRRWIEAIKAIRAGGGTEETIRANSQRPPMEVRRRTEITPSRSSPRGIFGGTSRKTGASAGRTARGSSMGHTTLATKVERQGSATQRREMRRVPQGDNRTIRANQTFGYRFGMEFYNRAQFSPTPNTHKGKLEQKSSHWPLGGFSVSPSTSGEVEGYREPTEDEIAEKIFDWWISGKPYSKWYSDTYLQMKIPFDFGEDNDKTD